MTDASRPLAELAIIPARGGSVGLPGKNIKHLGGVPLIAWTVISALRSGCFKRVVVSTDHSAIAKCAEAAGAEVPFMRPAHLANDTASSLDVVRHAIEELRCEQSIGLLQPTSPFRSAEHIRQAMKQFYERGAPALVSVVAAKPLEWSMSLDEGGILARALPNSGRPNRRQDSAALVQPNGALYLVQVDALIEERSFTPEGAIGYEMGKIDSIDIDDAEDFDLAKAIVASGLRAVDP